MGTIFKGAALITGEAFNRGRHLFQCGHLKVQRSLEGGVYLRPSTCKRKYGIWVASIKTEQLKT